MKSRRELVFGAAGLGAGLLVASAAQARTVSASASPTSVEGTGFDLSDTISVSVSGGTAPYSYSWVRLSGSGFIVANDPSGAETSFYWNGSLSGPARTSTWVCQVTDAASQTATTNGVTVSWDPAA